MGKPMIGVARILPLCALVSICLSGIAAQPAHAKLGPISIRSVYTTDENFNNKIVFIPGDKINFHVDVDNTTASTFPIDIRFEVFPANSLDPRPYRYGQTYRVDQMPVGLSRFYNPITLPSNAAVYLGYILRITITPSGCSGTGCTNDGDVGESRFSIQTTKAPEGNASNLVIVVHGCCTDANGVKEVWEDLANTIRSQTPGAWEVVVWDWHEYTTPTLDYVAVALSRGILAAIEAFKADADAAYQAAKQQGPVLANAIKLHRDKYKHVHFIGHSAGSKLIHEAATAYISDFLIRQQNPFIHQTFLDAYTPSDSDKTGQTSYGSLPTIYPNHYAEHYVDRSPNSIFAPTDACLENAFNFDITRWTPDKDDRQFEFGHQWPHRWYKKSVPPLFLSGYKYGYRLSFGGSGKNINELVNELAGYRAGEQCSLSDIGASCIPARCASPGSF